MIIYLAFSLITALFPPPKKEMLWYFCLVDFVPETQVGDC